MDVENRRVKTEKSNSTYKMISRNIKRSILPLLLLLSSCAVNPVTGQHELMLVSEAQELQIGREAAPSAKWEFGGHYRDSELESYLGGIINQLWRNSERPQLPVKFHIQNTSVPNAFALPGYVAITRGLLSDMDNEAQFAAVMGHEIGHVMARHTAQRLSRIQLQQLGLAIGAAGLGGKSGGDTLLKIGAVGSSLLLLNYSRSQELQADRLGVKYMSTLGYDPYEAITAHQVLERSVNSYLQRLGKSRSKDTFISELLSTHPRQEVRIDEIQEMIRQLPPFRIREDGKFSKTFQDKTRTIRETNKTYYLYDKAQVYYQDNRFSDAEQTLLEAIRENSHQSAFHNLLGLIKIRQEYYGQAQQAFQKALSIDPGYQPSLYGTGLVYYFEKKYSLAIHEFKKSLELFPGHLQSHFGMGKSHFQLAQYREAIPYLQNFASAVPEHPEVHGLLGIAYENTGEIRAAATEYRNQVIVAPDSELGRQAQIRLKVLELLLKKQ